MVRDTSKNGRLLPKVSATQRGLVSDSPSAQRRLVPQAPPPHRGLVQDASAPQRRLVSKASAYRRLVPHASSLNTIRAAEAAATKAQSPPARTAPASLSLCLTASSGSEAREKA